MFGHRVTPDLSVAHLRHEILRDTELWRRIPTIVTKDLVHTNLVRVSSTPVEGPS